MTKSNSPDLLIDLFAKSQEKIEIYDNFNYGMWYPRYYYPMLPSVSYSKYTEGTLFINFVDAAKKELVWQGIGKGAITILGGPQKEKRIQEFVTEMLTRYPPK